MRITEKKYLDTYIQEIGHEIPRLIQDFDFSENKRGFDYLTKSSAVYSSNIENSTSKCNFADKIGKFVFYRARRNDSPLL